MVSLADSLLSSSARALPVRVRPDLSARPHRYLGQVFWVVKEPVGLKYFRFQEEEYSILQMLDGQTSLDELKIEFESRFPPQKITVEELGRFVGMLHNSGLVIANVAGQGEQLRKQRTTRMWRETGAALTNVLAMRFKGIDPNSILEWIYPKVRWFFSVPAVIICMLFALSALLLVLVNFDAFRAKLPSFHQFFEASNWIYLGIMLCVSKVLHEFGHGLTCKHFGGECHELGVMMLVLTPCLYCNVSDSWMLPNKWHRAAIGAAGMYVEIVLASICTYLWWFSQPGLLNQLSLSTMFVCSVSTVVFNANPLLRFDGYYILSDLTEIPNLRQKASTILSRKLGTWCLGLEEPEDPFLPQRNQLFFALYTVAAAVYRWVILFGILFFLYKVFEPYGLKVISQMLAFVSIGSLVVMPAYKVGKFFYVPGRLHQVKRKNVYITLSILAVATAFILFCPLPYRVICPIELKPRDAEPVYVQAAGTLEQIDVKPGQVVNKGDKLGALSNIDLDYRINDLEATVTKDKIRVAVLRREQFALGNETSALTLGSAQEALVAAEGQLAQSKLQRDRLQLLAPAAGTVLPPRDEPERPQPQRLPTWSGNPLEQKNVGAFLEPPAVFCQIADPHKWEANIVVDQDNIEYVHEGQEVKIKLDLMPYRTFKTTIIEIGPEMEYTSPQLSPRGGGEVTSKTDPSGAERPMNVSYQARAAIDDDSGKLVQGLRGTAKIAADWQPIGKRVWRYLMRTFNFRL